MHASRLLSLLMLLQARGSLSAQALAAELEVSVRTIHRDIDQLSAAGVPVFASRGRSGGFQLRPGWRTQLTGLTEPESRALFLAGLSGPAAELGLGQAVASARLKVLASLPPEGQAHAERVSRRFHLDAVDWFRSAGETEHLAAVAQAVWNEQALAVRYQSWSGLRERELEPLGLVLKAGVWYMAARTGAQAEPRTYRLSRIHALTTLPRRFSAPRGFDLAAYWQESTRRFETGVYQGTADLRLSERGRHAMQDWSPEVAEAITQSAVREGRGRWRVSVPIESVARAADRILALGAEAEVLAPKALRDALRATTRRLAALYAPPRPSAPSRRTAKVARPTASRSPPS